MTLAISRYGTRVVPNTQYIVADLERRGELVEGPHLMAFTDAFSFVIFTPSSTCAVIAVVVVLP